MAFKHVAWAMHERVKDPLAKLLLVALADRADKETNQCWPSLARLCEDTEMSMATVARKLTYLEETGFITRDRRDNTSTLYTLSLRESHYSHTESSYSHTERPASLTVRAEPISKNLSENHKDMVINNDFEDWWSEYPKKKGKGQARLAFRGAIKKATKEELVTAVRKFAQSCVGKDKQFIPHASTWLNGERWNDEEDEQTWGSVANEL